MKKPFLYQNSIKLITILTVSLLFFSCASNKKWQVPAELVGQWTTNKHPITVRTEPKWLKFQFTSDSAIVILQINDDKTVNGSIGLATFKNGTIERNWGNPEKTGVAYIIKCGKIGKIFDNDPLISKEIEIWLSPIKINMEAEIRYTEKGAVFPMAGILFIKAK